MPLGFVLLASGALLLIGAVTGHHPWAPLVEAFGGTPPPDPGSGVSTAADSLVSGVSSATGGKIADALRPGLFGGGSINAVGQQVIAAARAQIGRGYLMGAGGGGRGPIDCSGLTQLAYASAGISIPHSSIAQLTICRRLKLKDAGPGDLAFFVGSDGVVFHVSIYLGNHQVIESAPSHGGVGVVDLNYQHRLLTFGRPHAVDRLLASDPTPGSGPGR